MEVVLDGGTVHSAIVHVAHSDGLELGYTRRVLLGRSVGMRCAGCDEMWRGEERRGTVKEGGRMRRIRKDGSLWTGRDRKRRSARRNGGHPNAKECRSAVCSCRRNTTDQTASSTFARRIVRRPTGFGRTYNGMRMGTTSASDARWRF